jgi:hypothetical protein
LVDALSRYNDLEPTPAQSIEEVASAAPRVFADS